MSNCRIRTLTLNPAVDRTVHIEDFAVNQVNRIGWSRLDAGGKGINVSKSIHGFGGLSEAYGIVAGSAGGFIENYLSDLNIGYNFVWTDGESRTNIKIVDPRNNTHTDINDQGPVVTEKALAELEIQLFTGVNPDTIFVFSGSIGRGPPIDIYKRWIAKARSFGARTILDADGEALRLGLEAVPTLVKPNIHELERLLGLNSLDKDSLPLGKIANAAKTLLARETEWVVVSLGSGGALFLGQKITLFARGIPVQVQSTVGAGDAMVAALALSLERRDPLSAMVTAAVGAGTAAVATEGTAVPSREALEHYRSLVTFEIIEEEL